MKMYAYLILAVVVASLLLQPLCEVLLVCSDTLTVNSAVNNAVMVAKKESFIYEDMKNAKTGIDEQTFKDEFAKVFMPTELTERGNGYFVPNDRDRFNDFYVDFDFDTERKGDRIQINVTVSVESEYKFKTKMLKAAEETIRNGPGIFNITYKRKHNLILIN